MNHDVPAVGAFAVIRGEEPSILLAESSLLMDRVLALQIVAQLPASAVESRARLNEMRSALLEERWADAVVLWIEETGLAVDVYTESPKIWTEEELDSEQASLEIRVAPLFAE
ncbi:MAG: hypothetical protein ACRDJL_12935 [Actinomycetota bacterium]